MNARYKLRDLYKSLVTRIAVLSGHQDTAVANGKDELAKQIGRHIDDLQYVLDEIEEVGKEL